MFAKSYPNIFRGYWLTEFSEKNKMGA